MSSDICANDGSSGPLSDTRSKTTENAFFPSGRQYSSFAITFFDDHTGAVARPEFITLAELARRVATTSAPAKVDLPWLKLATFGNHRSNQGSLRHNRNLISVSGVEIDYDGEKVSFDTAVETLEKAGLEALVYTSPSHLVDGHGPRWRLVLPFITSYPPEERSRFVSRIAGLFRDDKGSTVISGESWTRSQAYYYGRVNGSTEHRVEVVEGLRLDHYTFDELDLIALDKPTRARHPSSPGRSRNGGDSNHKPGPPRADIADIRAALAAIANSGEPDWLWWNDIGLATHSASAGSAEGYAAFVAFSERNDSFDLSEAEERWRSYTKSPPNGIGFGTLMYWAHRTQPSFRAPSQPDMHPGDPPDDFDARNGQTVGEEEPPQLIRPLPPAMEREHVFPRDLKWPKRLLRNDKGTARAILANAVIALRHAPEWQDRLWYDAFHNRVVLRGVPPWSKRSFVDEPWSDLFDNRTTLWMQHRGIYVSEQIVGRAVWTVARDQWFHPVRQYLETCRAAWDGRPRLADWPSTYLGTVASPYASAVGQRWMIALVARVMEPGCKADCALVLEGAQGIFKSEVLRRLGWPWVTDDMGGSQLGSKDSALQVAGVWIMELAELDQFTTGRDVAKTKAFMSRMTDRFRPPYGTHPIPQPRQCGFGCTTNKNEYLPDETGNRRWWPIECCKIDLEQLEANRNHLFGEAVALYQSGHPWWLDTPQLNALAAVEQNKRYVPDSWDALISHYLDHPTDEIDDGNGRKTTIQLPPLDSVTVPEILGKVLNIPPGLWKQADENRVAKSLRGLHWKRKQKSTHGEREWRYLRPDPDV